MKVLIVGSGGREHAIAYALSKSKKVSEIHAIPGNPGISAIVQPGGSVRDQDSIDLCNELNIPMVFTGYRHFRH